jgi:hypothetical protein
MPSEQKSPECKQPESRAFSSVTNEIIKGSGNEFGLKQTHCGINYYINSWW